jgi:formylglycine-generating enzyme required for sulfatase activity
MSRSKLPFLLLIAAIVILAVSWIVVFQRGPSLEGPQVTLDLGDGITMEFVRIPAGTFMMGSEDGYDNEKPVHQVTVSRDFYLGKYEVTQEQWQAVMGTNPSGHAGEMRPVEMVSWDDAVAFTEALARSTGHDVRLPTEAEWEHACRAATTTRYYFGDATPDLADHGWAASNSEGMTHFVGRKLPNAWGLYDMLGNIWEWCSDWYDAGYYDQSAATDPVGPPSGTDRVIRGGGYLLRDMSVRSAARGHHPPNLRFKDLGLRVVVEPS